MFNRWTYSENIRSVPRACVCHPSCLGGCGRRGHWSLEVQGLCRQQRRHFLKTNKQTNRQIRSQSKSLKLQQESGDPHRAVVSGILTALQASSNAIPLISFEETQLSCLALGWPFGCFVNTQSFLLFHDLYSYSSRICTPLTSYSSISVFFARFLFCLVLRQGLTM